MCEGEFEGVVEGAEAAALFLGGVFGGGEVVCDLLSFEDEVEMGALGADEVVLVDLAAEGLGGVVVEDGEEDGEGDFELGVKVLEGGVLEKEEGLDLVEEGGGEGLVWSGIWGGVWGGGWSGNGGG